jgi:hypothetical protein
MFENRFCRETFCERNLYNRKFILNFSLLQDFLRKFLTTANEKISDQLFPPESFLAVCSLYFFVDEDFCRRKVKKSLQ